MHSAGFEPARTCVHVTLNHTPLTARARMLVILEGFEPPVSFVSGKRLNLSTTGSRGTAKLFRVGNRRFPP